MTKEIEKRRGIEDSLTNREDINDFIFYGCFHFIISNLDNKALSNDSLYKQFYNICIKHNLEKCFSDKDIAQLYLYCRVFKNSLPTKEERDKQKGEQQKLDDRDKDELQLINLMIPVFSPYKPIIEIKTNNKDDGRGIINDSILVEEIRNYTLSIYKEQGFNIRPISLKEAMNAIEQKENYPWVNAYKDKSSVQFMMLYDIDTFNKEMAVAYSNSHKIEIEPITYDYLLKRKAELVPSKTNTKRGRPSKAEEDIQFALKLGYILRFQDFIKQDKYQTIQGYLDNNPLANAEYRAIYALLNLTGIKEQSQDDNTTTPEKYLRTRFKAILSKEDTKQGNLSTEGYLTHLRAYLRNETNFTPLYTNIDYQTVNYSNYTIK